MTNDEAMQILNKHYDMVPIMPGSIVFQCTTDDEGVFDMGGSRLPATRTGSWRIITGAFSSFHAIRGLIPATASPDHPMRAALKVAAKHWWTPKQSQGTPQLSDDDYWDENYSTTLVILDPKGVT